MQIFFLSSQSFFYFTFHSEIKEKKMEATKKRKKDRADEPVMMKNNAK